MENKKLEVLELTNIGIGTRISIDFIDELEIDEYILVGNVCKGYLGILSECRKTETYPPREFRINAGAIHQYIYIGNNKTKYLSEIEPGDKICIFSKNGDRTVAVGRIKKEKREMMRLVLKDEDFISATLQIADSVHLVADEIKSVIDLKVGDIIDVFKSDIVATHKGDSIEEYIVEK